MDATNRPTGGLVGNLCGSVSVGSIAAETVGAQLAFVFAAKQSKRRMTSQAYNVVFGLFSHIRDELWMCRVDSTSELEVLPH